MHDISRAIQVMDGLLVPHRAFQTALDRITDCVSYYMQGGGEPMCIAVIGESRTGKSRAGKFVLAQHPPYRTDEGMVVPMFRAVVQSKPTVKGLAEDLLRGLGSPDWTRGTENAKTGRLMTLFKECGVRALLLDEFQHFYDKTGHKVQHHVADWLKTVVDESGVALIVSGLPSLKAVIDQNSQLAGRFSQPVVMPRFDWLNSEHREEWKAILGAFYDALVDIGFDLPVLDRDEMALRMYLATGGLMGYLTKTLRQAVLQAQAKNLQVITLEDLESANRAALWNSEGRASSINPFNRAAVLLGDAASVEQAQRIGVDLPPPPPPPRTRVRKGVA